MRNRQAYDCECTIQRRVESRIPPRYRNASLIDFPEKLRNDVIAWLAKPTDGLLIFGNVGGGKTHLCAAMVRSQLLIRQDSVRFERCAEFYGRLRESYRANTPEEDAWENLPKVKFLYLDDLGSGSLSDHERRATLDLLDRRLNAMRATIINTNWTLKEISEKMDERIASRLQSFTLLRLTGEDRRAKVLGAA